MAELPEPFPPLDPSSKTIRLLTLKQALHDLDGRLVCSLTVASLNDAPAYEALSYVWGEPTPSDSKIWINDRLVSIRSNLASALRAIHGHGVPERLLWIDALCINQADVVERNHRVGLMDLVYKRAEIVLVWLGMPNEISNQESLLSDSLLGTDQRTQDTFDFVRQVANDPLTTKYSNATEMWQKTFLKNPAFYKHWRHLMRLLCETEYWTRLWIIQEIGLASQKLLLYGNCSCDWNHVILILHGVSTWASDRIEWLSVGSDYLRSDLEDVLLSLHFCLAMKLHNPRQLCNKKLTLSNLLKLTSGDDMGRCSDPRDRVYGLLGLAEDVQLGDISIDYRNSISAIYIDCLLFQSRKTAIPRTIVEFSHSLQVILNKPTSRSGQANISQNLRSGEEHLSFSLANTEAESSLLGRELLVDGSTVSKISIINVEGIKPWPSLQRTRKPPKEFYISKLETLMGARSRNDFRFFDLGEKWGTIGVISSVAQDGDILAEFTGALSLSIAAIVRQDDKGGYRFICPAFFSKSLVDDAGYPHSDRNDLRITIEIGDLIDLTRPDSSLAHHGWSTFKPGC